MDVIKKENEQFDEKLNKIFEGISIAIINNDKQKVNDFINQSLCNVRKLRNECNKDAIRYYISKFLMRFLVTFPGIRVNACEKFDVFLTKALESVYFEKESLRELRNYLTFCKTNGEYDDLLLSFSILITILLLHNNRIDEGSVNASIWNCGMSGITYVPSSSVKIEDTSSLQDNIKSNLEVLRKVRSKS